METGGGEPQKRLAKMKKRCFLIPADYNNMVSIRVTFRVFRIVFTG